MRFRRKPKLAYKYYGIGVAAIITLKCRFIFLLLVSFVLFSCTTQKPVTKVKGPRELELGDKATLSWQIEEADSIHLEGIQDFLPSTGEITLQPDTTTQYVFLVYRKKEKVRKKRYKISVVVPEIDAFTLPDSTTDEQPIEFQWRTSNAKYVIFSGNADTLRPSGRLEWQPDSTMSVKLTAYGDFNSVSETRYIKVHVLEGVEGSATMYRGGQGMLRWEFKNSEYVKVSGFEEHFNAADTLFVQPNETNLYTLTVFRKNGKKSEFEHEIKVLSPYIKTFRAPTYVKKGENTFISWNAIGTKFAILDGDTVKSNGSKMIQVDEDQNHTLTIFNGEKPVTQEIKIQLLPQRAFVTKVDPKNTFKKGQRLECDIIAVDQSDYPREVRLHVLVVDTMGNYVSKLAPPFSNEKYSKSFFNALSESTNGRFKSKEFGVKEIHMDTTIQYDIAMALDHSGSMLDIIDSLQKASSVFISNKYPKDRISIVKFDDQLARKNELSMSKKSILIKSEFSGLDGFGGGTALYAGTDEGIYALTDGGKNRVLLVFTDGYENASFMHFGSRAFHPNQVAAKVRDMGIKMFIVSYGENVNLPLLTQLAEMSGGKHYNILRTQDIQEVFKELPRVMRHYYEISFVPEEQDGEHKIQLRFNNQKGAMIKVETSLFIGDDFDLSELEFKKELPWKKYLPSDSAKAVAAPQKVANFDFDEEIIKEKYYKNIDRFAEYLEKNKFANALILGHTDSRCNSGDYCKKLSKKRAEQVKDYLIEKGVNEKRIMVIGCGFESPVWLQETEDWKAAENRRVEILLFEY